MLSSTNAALICPAIGHKNDTFKKCPSAKPFVSSNCVGILRTGHTPHNKTCIMNARKRAQWWSDSWMDSSPLKLDEEIITFFSSDGSITNVPSIPTLYSSDQHRSPPHIFRPLSSEVDIPPQPSRSVPLQEDQGLCIGSVFTIRATNGIDSSRRIKVVGFCQSIDHLYETVEYAVSRQGGEIFSVKKKITSDVHECLSMALALPMLFGVPPRQDQLKASIQMGGGIIDSIYKEWFILG